VNRDTGETQGNLPPLGGPTVEFDPASGIIPFPNNLVINPMTGKVDVPAPPCETPAAMAVRVGTLNQLDGFGTYEAAMQVTFTDDVDPATLTGNIVMYERVGPHVGHMVPVTVVPSTALRFNAADCAAPAQIHAVTIIPMEPLDQKSTYSVALLSGIKTTSGQAYIPSFTWALVRQTQNPVTLRSDCDLANPTPSNCQVLSNLTPLTPGPDPSGNPGDANHNGIPDIVELVGLNQLWNALAPGLMFLDSVGHSDRSTILVAWDVTTQTTTDQLDPSVAGSPASTLATDPLLGTRSVVVGNTRNFIENVYQGFGFTQQQAQAYCTQIGCDNVGDVLGAGLAVTTYQQHVANPWSGMTDVPGQWTDPIHPTAQGAFQVPGIPAPGILPVLAFVPQCPNPLCVGNNPPPNGWPVVVFGHGLGSQKESLFLLAPQLATQGFASVAIDFVDHGARAVRVTAEPSLGCSGTCSTTTTTVCKHDTDCPATETCNLPGFAAADQCFAPFLSPDLGGTRDNIRQTVLDLQRLTLAVKACSTTNCSNFQVDPAEVLYTGISLGGIIGSTTNAVDPNFKAAVLNVSGVGWLDILENTETLAIKCPLVNGLIDAGIVQGTKFDPANPTVGTCLTDDWKMQPGYQQFAVVARIILDPADGANFTQMLKNRRLLLQEVIGDKVVPNIATNNEGMLLGLMPAAADLYLPTVNTAPSAAITAMPLENHWLQYNPIPASTTTGPGNAFSHGSLLSPGSTQASQLGTARLQTDAIFFLSANK
jgi:hypothetical protein